MKKISLLAMLLSTAGFAQENPNKLALGKIIPKIDFNGDDPQLAFEALSGYASKAGAIEEGFKGIIIDKEVPLKRKSVTLNLKEIPFGEAISVISEQFGASWKMENGVVYIGIMKADETMSFLITSKVRNGLGLPLDGPVAVGQVLDALKARNVRIGAEELRIANGSVIVTARHDEVIFIKSILRVIDRDLKVIK